MVLKKVKLKSPYYLAYPMITPLITASTEKKDNVMTATWTTPISIDPPLYAVSIAPSRYTHQLITKSNEFGVCFLDFAEVEKVLKAGRISGQNLDKFDQFGIEKQDASTISAPLIKSAVSALECKVEKTISLGDHTLFAGEVVAAWAKQNVIENNVMNLEKVKPVFYLGSNRFCTTQEWDKEITS